MLHDTFKGPAKVATKTENSALFCQFFYSRVDGHKKTSCISATRLCLVAGEKGGQQQNLVGNLFILRGLALSF
jgi:hypothetical protein